MLEKKMKIKGRVCMSYLYNEQIFQSKDFESMTREEDITNWEIKEGAVTKNGERYESDAVRGFFDLYMGNAAW